MNTVRPPTETHGVSHDRLVRFAAALSLTGVSRSKAYRLIADGCFPRPTKVGRTNLFSERELQDWVAHQLHAREEA